MITAAQRIKDSIKKDKIFRTIPFPLLWLSPNRPFLPFPTPCTPDPLPVSLPSTFSQLSRRTDLWQRHYLPWMWTRQLVFGFIWIFYATCYICQTQPKYMIQQWDGNDVYSFCPRFWQTQNSLLLRQPLNKQGPHMTSKSNWVGEPD